MYVTLTDRSSGHAITPVSNAISHTVKHKGSHRRTRPGQTLFLEDDEARMLFEVVTGVVRLSRVTSGGRRQVISFGFPGDVLGFPDNGRHHADCDVLEGGEVIAYPVRLLSSPGQDPELNRYLVRAAMQEIAGMQDHFVVLGRKCATEKTAAFLGVLAERIGKPTSRGRLVSLPMYRSDIADFLGLSSETVSRAFTHLRELGIIKLVTAKDILIRDIAALAALAEFD